MILHRLKKSALYLLGLSAYMSGKAHLKGNDWRFQAKSISSSNPTKANSPLVIFSSDAAIKTSFNSAICTRQIITERNKEKIGYQT